MIETCARPTVIYGNCISLEQSFHRTTTHGCLPGWSALSMNPSSIDDVAVLRGRVCLVGEEKVPGELLARWAFAASATGGVNAGSF